MPSKQVKLEDAASNLAKIAADPNGETVLTVDGQPKAVLLGLQAYQAALALVSLAKHPLEHGAAIAEHHRFQAGQAIDAIPVDKLHKQLHQEIENNRHEEVDERLWDVFGEFVADLNPRVENVGDDEC